MLKVSKRSIPLRRASEELGVSEETVKNWLRSGILCSRAGGIDAVSLENVKKTFSKNSEKLISRANKSRSVRNLIPYELLSSKDDRILLRKIISEKSDLNIGRDDLIDLLLEYRRGTKNIKDLFTGGSS